MFQYNFFVTLAPIAAIISIVIAVYAWRYRAIPGAMRLFAYTLVVVGFLLTDLLGLIDPTFSGTLFWAKFSYLFMALLPVSWFAFALQYAGRHDWLRPGRFWLFLIVPAATFILVQTTELHGLVWKQYFFRPVGQWLAISVTYGTWFLVSTLYAYILFVVGVALILREYWSAYRLHRQQSIWIIVGAVVPLAFNLVFVFDLIPNLHKDFSPLGYALSGVAFAIGMFKFRLFDLMPVARATLLDRMRDGVLVLDMRGRLVDLNMAARRILGLASEGLIDRSIADLLPGWYKIEEWQLAEFSVETAEMPRFYEVERTQLVIGKHSAGQLIVLHDITERRRAQLMLERVNEDLERRVLQRTQDLRQRAGELEALVNFSTALRKSVSLDDTLSILVTQTVQIFGAKTCVVFLLSKEELVVAGTHGFAQDCRGVGVPAAREPYFSCMQSDHSVVVNETDLSVLRQDADLGQFFAGVDTVLFFPLQVQEDRLGILQVGFCGDKQIYREYRYPLTGIAEIAGNAIQRVKVLQTLEQLVGARTRDLTTLYEITALANEFLDLRTILDRTLEKIVEVFASPVGILHLWEEENQRLSLVAQCGLSLDQMTALQYWDSAEALWRRVMERNQIVMHSKWQQVMPDIPLSGFDVFPMYIGVPVHAKGKALGVLSVLVEQIHKYSAEDVALLVAVADQVGSAAESARLRQQAELAAVGEERQRLARELHDSVTQSLYSLMLFAAAGRDATGDADLERVGRYFDRLSDTAQQALREMRLLIYELRPTVLQEEGLVGALRRRLEVVEKRAGLETDFIVDELPELPVALETGLYNIAQEALNNVIKHSGATQIVLRLGNEASLIHLTVKDNGAGFSPFAVSRGIGLSSMQERAARLGGVLQIESSAGRGTLVHAKIPFSRR